MDAAGRAVEGDLLKEFELAVPSYTGVDQGGYKGSERRDYGRRERQRILPGGQRGGPVVGYGDKSVTLSCQVFACGLVLDGRRTEVGPGDDLVDVEGGMVAAVVVVWIDMGDLVSRLCQCACRGVSTDGNVKK